MTIKHFSTPVTHTGSVDHKILRITWNKCEDALIITTNHDTTLINMNETQTSSIYKDIEAISSDWKCDGSIVAVSDYKNKIILLIKKNGELKRILQEHVRQIVYKHTRWNPTGSLIGGSGIGGKVIIWKSISGEILCNVKFPTEMSIDVFDWNTDYSFAAACEDGTIYYCNMHEEIEIKRFVGHQQKVIDLKWNPQKTILASRSEDFTIKLWTPEQSSCIREIPITSSVPKNIEWLSSGYSLLTSVNKSKMHIVDIANGGCYSIKLSNDRKTQISEALVNPNGTLIGCTTRQKFVIVLCMDTCEFITKWKLPNKILIIQWSPLGNKLFVGTTTGDYYIFDVWNQIDNA